nr:hypothetical protein CFP56_24303 [Quercus suber]
MDQHAVSELRDRPEIVIHTQRMKAFLAIFDLSASLSIFTCRLSKICRSAEFLDRETQRYVAWANATYGTTIKLSTKNHIWTLSQMTYCPDENERMRLAAPVRADDHRSYAHAYLHFAGSRSTGSLWSVPSNTTITALQVKGTVPLQTSFTDTRRFDRSVGARPTCYSISSDAALYNTFLSPIGCKDGLPLKKARVQGRSVGRACAPTERPLFIKHISASQRRRLDVSMNNTKIPLSTDHGPCLST